MQVFELNMWRAWGAVATTVASVSLSVYLIAISPWYLLPLAWAFAGTAWTGVCPGVVSVVPCTSGFCFCIRVAYRHGVVCLPAAYAVSLELSASCCETGVSASVMLFVLPNRVPKYGRRLSHQLWGAAVCSRPRLRTPQLQ